MATTSLAGCFGCHMSFLDIDERILELIELVDLELRELLSKYEFPGDDTPIIRGSALKAMEKVSSRLSV